ncbi:pyridoxine 5'-phosphate synthase [Puniceicoccus vermicola]|uniref:Pyridoxine 5'-phosphate synthase n=1 Tax=Puniceicoccus vermicola TaxID=388746 RepID=A0A7X1B2C5_9BACT|nr:pyridoxine 5'-phosphate synthase [Puniceicoccus vermicola]MBC2603135.1 pyridoxine 5'-phosphate synthase [Puniceicoccus vermicola]
MSSPYSRPLLGVNIDHCATLRQARYRDMEKTCGGFIEPDPIQLAIHAEKAGADGITVHLREDRRHIQDRDVYRLRESIATRLNLEMACTKEMVQIALDLRPTSVCLVPENRQEVTTEGGLDLESKRDEVQEIVETLGEAGIDVSLFIDPHPKQIELAAELRAPYIELHTGAYAHAYGTPRQREEWERLVSAAQRANRSEITVNAGHGINYVNIGNICQLPHLHELNIGHSILSRALFYGIEEAVREMKIRMSAIHLSA